jgi:hypothetical protein
MPIWHGEGMLLPFWSFKGLGFLWLCKQVFLKFYLYNWGISPPARRTLVRYANPRPRSSYSYSYVFSHSHKKKSSLAKEVPCTCEFSWGVGTYLGSHPKPSCGWPSLSRTHSYKNLLYNFHVVFACLNATLWLAM